MYFQNQVTRESRPSDNLKTINNRWNHHCYSHAKQRPVGSTERNPFARRKKRNLSLATPSEKRKDLKSDSREKPIRTLVYFARWKLDKKKTPQKSHIRNQSKTCFCYRFGRTPGEFCLFFCALQFFLITLSKTISGTFRRCWPKSKCD